MKSSEIYNLWALFDKATSDPAFNAEQKHAVGTDMLNALPPEMLCSSSKPTLDVVREAMEGRLSDLDNERRKSKTGLRAGTSPVARPGGADQSEAKGDGVSVASLVDPSEKPGRPRKASPKE